MLAGTLGLLSSGEAGCKAFVPWLKRTTRGGRVAKRRPVPAISRSFETALARVSGVVAGLLRSLTHSDIPGRGKPTGRFIYACPPFKLNGPR